MEDREVVWDTALKSSAPASEEVEAEADIGPTLGERKKAREVFSPTCCGDTASMVVPSN